MKLPQMLRYFGSLSLWLSVLATNLPARAKGQHWPTGLQLSVDVLRPLYYQYYQKTGSQYELNMVLDFAKLVLAGDWGWGAVDHKHVDKKISQLTAYKSSGKYFLVCLNYNWLQDMPDKNVFSLGL